VRSSLGAVDGIARLETVDGHHRGMGILVAPRLVLTCSHVVNLALGRDATEATEPGSRASIVVGFPFADDVKRTATIKSWHPPGVGRPDSTLLLLHEPAPDKAGIATLAEIADPTRLEGALTIYGLTEDQVLGGHVEAALTGPVAGGWWQIVGTRDIGVYAVRGFSGAAVWSRAERAVVAMLVAVAAVADSPEPVGAPLTVARRTAYAQPVAIIRAAIASLPTERRTGSVATQRLYMISAVSLLLVALVNLLALHSKEMLGLLPYANGSRIIAAHVAVCVIALLAWLPLRLMRDHVRSLAFHPWYQRVPSLLVRYPSESLLNTRTGSAAALVFILALPLWAQGDALRQFQKGSYTVLVAEERFDKAKQCPGHCPSEEAGLFQIVALPRPGDVLDLYVDDAYRLAAAGDGSDKSVTFFPVLQPALVLGLTAYAAFLALTTLFELFVRPRWSTERQLEESSRDDARS
jgi:hypothetical protein